MRAFPLRLFALLLAGSLVWSGCSRGNKATEQAPLNDEQKHAQLAAEVPDRIQKQWTFLNRLRQHEPFDVIIRTMVDDQDQLGVELDSSVSADKVPDLMKQVMAKMAEEFPHQDFTLTAYASTNPLRKFGTVHLEGKTGQATYTPTQ